MNQLIQRSVAVKATYTNLVAGSLVATVDVTCPSGNAATVYFRGDDGSDVPWEPGEWHTFLRVDLGRIQIKGTDGDIVTIVGGTW